MAKKNERNSARGLWGLDLVMDPRQQNRTKEIVNEMGRLESMLKAAAQGKPAREPGNTLEKRGSNVRRLTRMEEQRLRQEKFKHVFTSLVLLAVLIGLASWLSHLLKV